MDSTRVDERNPWLVPAAVLGGCMLLGLVLGGWMLGTEIKETRLSDRYVTVKGLVERTVKSDSAVWPVTFKETGNDLQQVYAKSEEDRAAVLKFFAAQGITPQEISVGQIQVTDKQANEYGGNNNSGPRYIVQQTVTVSSGDVDKISKAGQKTAQLLQAGIIVVGGYGQGIRYVFNGLNALKPDMITRRRRMRGRRRTGLRRTRGARWGRSVRRIRGCFRSRRRMHGSGMAPGMKAAAGRRRIRMRAS